MKFGFVLPNNYGLEDPATVIDLAVEAEECGFDSVWVNHHVINIGYIADRLGDRPYYDALTVLTWAAARTSRVRLGTSVLVMPYLHPMVLAKTLATLDRLSGGRVIAGLGVGSLPEENEVLGVGYDDRGAWSDEFIEVMLALWSPGPATFQGEHFSMQAAVASPKPTQAALEVWIGGSGGPARRRTARFGRGWHPLTSVDGLRRRLPRLVEALEAEGRTRADLVVAPRVDVSVLADQAAVDAWAEAGADQLIVMTNSSDLDTVRAGLAHTATLID